MSKTNTNPEATMPATYIAKSGDTKYEVIDTTRGGSHTFVRVSVLWPTGWHVSNPRTTFRTSHIAEMVESGKWTVEQPQAAPALQVPYRDTDDYYFDL